MKCPALREVLVPDDIWADYRRISDEDLDDARHHQILLGALSNGYLSKLTLPIHRYMYKFSSLGTLFLIMNCY